MSAKPVVAGNQSSIAQSPTSGREGDFSKNEGDTRESGNIENCNFKISSQNGRGLRTDKVKRNKLFQFLKKMGTFLLFKKRTAPLTQRSNGKWKVNVMYTSQMEQVHPEV